MDPIVEKTRQPMFAGYPFGNSYDEMFVADHGARDHCQRFLDRFSELGKDELNRRWYQAATLVHENGWDYSDVSDYERSRPWKLDVMPLLFSADDWQVISQGLEQRALLMDAVLKDIYGPRQSLRDGLLPPQFVFANPGFERAYCGLPSSGERHLHIYAADIARGPDGRWVVVADRANAPLGMGYALENRIVMSQVFPKIFRDQRIQRLVGFFDGLRERLQRLAPRNRDNPHVVLLTEGHQNPNHFEDSYLARYLGFTMVEGGDLAVRDNRVYLKTLGGLLLVDVIFRRLSDQRCDPLELNAAARKGVPGLVQAVRAGNVAVANSLGTGVIESPLLLPFLPGLCRHFLGEELMMNSIETWWCGDTAARNQVTANASDFMFRAAYRSDRRSIVSSHLLRQESKDTLFRRIAANPNSFVAQRPVVRSFAPTWTEHGMESARIGMRVFVVSTETGFQVMPGGLVRVSTASQPLDYSILAGESSKDACILAEESNRSEPFSSRTEQLTTLRRATLDLPSRVAEDLFWLGRNIERSESAARLLRTTVWRLAGEQEAATISELPFLTRIMAQRGLIEPGYAVAEIEKQLPPLEQALAYSVFNQQQPGNYFSTLIATYRAAAKIRDRMSKDSWRIVCRIENEVKNFLNFETPTPSDLLTLLNQLIIDLAAYGGLVVEGMTRAQDWRFLDLGRRLEKSLSTVEFVNSALKSRPENESAVLDAVLNIADCGMTYRSRYLANVQMTPVLDLLLTDESNPRSLASQLALVAEHVEGLPRETGKPLRGAEQRMVLSALHSVRVIDLELLEGKKGDRTELQRLLTVIEQQLPKLSDLITHRYFIHAGVPKQLNGLGA